jgi:hypothetical protein
LKACTAEIPAIGKRLVALQLVAPRPAAQTYSQQLSIAWSASFPMNFKIPSTFDADLAGTISNSEDTAKLMVMASMEWVDDPHRAS